MYSTVKYLGSKLQKVSYKGSLELKISQFLLLVMLMLLVGKPIHIFNHNRAICTSTHGCCCSSKEDASKESSKRSHEGSHNCKICNFEYSLFSESTPVFLIGYTVCLGFMVTPYIQGSESEICLTRQTRAPPVIA